MDFKDWKKYKLGNIIDLKNGKSKSNSTGTYPIYGGNGILGYTNQYNVEGETLIIGRVGAYCGATYYEKNPCWVSDNALYGKAVPHNNHKFLYYLLKNANLNQYAGGSTHPLLTQSRLVSLEIRVPSIQMQTHIAAILTSLDDKIELNRQNNKTLETIAQTLFQEMCLPKAGESMNSKKRVLFDICKLIGGGTPKTSVKEYWENGTIDWISAKDLTPNHGSFIIQTEKKITELGLKHSSAKLLPALTTVISARGTVGNVCILAKPMTISQSNYALKATLPNRDYYLFHVVLNLVNELKQRVSGTIFDTITTSTLSDLEIQVPTDPILMKFNEIVQPIFEQIKINLEENQTLITLRDTLLPKLMRGEIALSS